MYYIIVSLISALAIYVGCENSDSAPLWNITLVFGGLYLGHAITDALIRGVK